MDKNQNQGEELYSVDTTRLTSGLLMKAYGKRNLPVIAMKSNGNLVLDTYKVAEKKNLKIIRWATKSDVSPIKTTKNGKQLS